MNLVRARGAFTVKGLPPGDYHAVAVEGLDRAARQDPTAFLPQLLGASARVSAGAGAEQRTTLRLTQR